MDYRALGGTGLKVSHLCLGAMMFGAWGNADHAESVRIIHAALDGGVNFVDTADVYSHGESEEIVGQALTGRRDHVVLATKFHGRMGDDQNMGGNSRRWVQQACEASLRRLGTDWIDVYQVHRPDPATDIDETLGALSDLVHAGKVRYLGSSTFPPSAIVEAQWVAERRGRERFVCEQPPYSIFARGVEADVLPTCLRHRMGVVAWSPLNGGWLTGKYRTGQEPPAGSRGARNWAGRFDAPESRRKLELVDELSTVAADAGMSLTHLAQAWVVRHPAVTSAIIGPRTMDHLTDLLAGQDVVLDTATLDRIDDLVAPGTNVNPGDAGWTSPDLEPRARRRS
jgi:aryl-alcohol dehydrogenase-like predicted oxidoreductase